MMFLLADGYLANGRTRTRSICGAQRGFCSEHLLCKRIVLNRLF